MFLVNRVRNIALALSKGLEKQPDMLVLELIALFHDMAGKSPPERGARPNTNQQMACSTPH